MNLLISSPKMEGLAHDVHREIIRQSPNGLLRILIMVSPQMRDIVRAEVATRSRVVKLTEYDHVVTLTELTHGMRHGKMTIEITNHALWKPAPIGHVEIYYHFGRVRGWNRAYRSLLMWHSAQGDISLTSTPGGKGTSNALGADGERGYITTLHDGPADYCAVLGTADIYHSESPNLISAPAFTGCGPTSSTAPDFDAIRKWFHDAIARCSRTLRRPTSQHAVAACWSRLIRVYAPEINI